MAMPKRTGPRNSNATWAKLKYDRRIVATAVVTQSSVIYSDDKHIRTLAKRAKIEVIRLADLPLPPEDAQKLGLEAPGDVTEPSPQELEEVRAEIEREEGGEAAP